MPEKIFLAFIPIFVAVDAIGILPVFVSLTKGTGKKERVSIIVQSLITAACLATGFIFLGKAIFSVLGVTIGDFMIAGGAVLFCLSMMDLLMPGKRRRIPAKELGVVPLGTPLIVGPAVLTTSLMIIPVYGLYPTLIAVLLNIVLAGMILMFSGVLMAVLGEAGTRALSKVTSLLLAAIAVMMMRRGVLYLIEAFR